MSTGLHHNGNYIAEFSAYSTMLVLTMAPIQSFFNDTILLAKWFLPLQQGAI